MKTTMLVLFIVLAAGTAFAQDTTATPAGNFYADSLKSTTWHSGNGTVRDTVDVVVSSMLDIDYFEMTVEGNGSANDTLIVSTLSFGGTLYAQHAVVSLASGSTAAAAIVGATPVDFVVGGGPQIKTLRFTSTGTTNNMRFWLSGKRGIPIY